MRDRLASLALAAMLVPGVLGSPAAAAVALETEVHAEAAFPPDDTSLPDVVGITARPRVISSAAGPLLAVSPDAEVSREDLGPGVLPEAPFPWAGEVDVRCLVGGEPDVPVVVSGAFLRDHYSWSALQGEAPAGWQGASVTNYHAGGAWIFPDQPPSPAPGTLELRDSMVTTHPVLPSSACGQDLDTRILIDFHVVSLAAEDGDVSYPGGARLGRALLPLRDGWQGSLFGYFTPPGAPVEVLDKVVVDPETGRPAMRIDLFAKRAGTWRRSLPTPQGRTWQWRFQGFNLFDSDLALGGGAEVAADASLRVLPGMRLLRVWPEGGAVRSETLVAPGFGSGRLTERGVVFDDLVRPVRPDPAPRREAAAHSAPASADPPPIYRYCTHAVLDAFPPDEVCMALGTDGGGTVALTELSMGPDRDALEVGMPFVSLDGTRYALTPATLVEPPIAIEYQYGDNDPAASPVDVVYLFSRHAVGGARFTMFWLAVDYPTLYGRQLWPAMADVRTAAHSRAEPVWYVHPTFASPRRTRIAEGITGAPVPAALTVPARNGFLTGPDFYWATDEGVATRTWYAPDPPPGEYHPSGLAWVSYDARTTFANWSGAPSPAPALEAAAAPLLGDDVAIYKQDFIESFFLSRGFDAALGPYGMVFGYYPMSIGFA